MLHEEGILALFRGAVDVPDRSIDLADAALLIAQTEYAELDRQSYVLRLAEMGREAARSCRGDLLEKIDCLNALLFDRWGFRGNREDYYDLRNSFLNDVMDRRMGIPITLALVTMEVGRGAGIELVGVGMPSHFLVGIAGGTEVYLDPFNSGQVLSREDCVARLRTLRPDLAFRPDFLAPVTRRQFLLRMLNNLLGITLNRSDHARALPIVKMMACVDPANPEWIHRRALIHTNLMNYSLAIRDLETYLEGNPKAPDQDEVAHQIALLHQLRATVN